MNETSRVVYTVSLLVVGVVAAALFPSSTPAAGCPRKPVLPPPKCQVYHCNVADAAWELVPVAAGTACDDGDACTYGDHCDGVGNCVATRIVCSNQCDMCNGTSACVKRPAGTACPNPSNPCEAVCDGVSPYCQPL